ncbi:MAG: prolipoprotein diacylglyceryl transferase [Dehalococcoidia bacterium]
MVELGALAIEIGIDPDIGRIGGLLVTWHGLFTAVGVVAGFLVAAYFGRRAGIGEDDIYNLGLAVIVGGIIGARVLFVLENHSRFADDPADIFAINAGGITIYGALIGAGVLGLAYGIWRRLPLWRAADAVVMGTIIGMAVGRVGDVINGEHFASATDWPIAVVYTDSDSPGFGRPPTHLAVGYELVGDLIIFGIMLVLWRWRPLKLDGFVYLAWAFLYGAMRLGISFYREDDIILGGLRMAQLIGIGAMAATVAAAVYLLAPRRPPTRAERRRALRARRPS